jgi:5-methylcytosine-specific restriction protein A
VSLRPCAEPGCPTLVPTGTRCATHARQQDLRRGSQRERGYTHAWEITAARFKRSYPLCGQRPNDRPPVMSRCHDEGRVTVATCVDHVAPHRGDPGRFWDPGNWQSLCDACHSAKTRANL